MTASRVVRRAKALIGQLLGRAVIPLVALLLAFAAGAVLIAARGSSVGDAYSALFRGAFGDVDSLGNTVNKTTPLLLCGLAVTVGYRGGMFNIGAEGQLILGGMAATSVALHFGTLSPWILTPLLLAAGAVSGALWSLLPAALRVARGFNEVITTLMMNYIAIQLLAWAVRVDTVARPGWRIWQYLPIKDPGQPFPRSATIPENGQLPVLWQAARIDAGVILALIITAVIYLVLVHSTAGFVLRAVGLSPRAARYAGFPVGPTLLSGMLISGALAGLAGAIEIAGHQHRIIDGFLAGGGYDGIPVALIGQLHPFGVLCASVVFGALRAGANTMQIMADVPVSLVYILQSLAILFSLVGLAIPNRWTTSTEAGTT